MFESIRVLWEAMQTNAERSQERLAELLQLCEECGVPRVTIFVYLGDGWYDMCGAYVLTERTDANEFIWHVTMLFGFGIFDANGFNRRTLEEWDPHAVLIVPESLFEGSTTVDPKEWMRRRRAKPPAP